MYKILLLLFALAITIMSHAQTTTIAWSYDVHDASFGQSAAADIDGDGKLEIVFGCYRNDGYVYALNAEDGSLLWKYNTAQTGVEGCNDVAPLIYDIDGDGIPEVILASSCTPKTYCFDGATGNIKWVCETGGSDSPPTIGDIDQDGHLEILHGQFDGSVICIDAETGVKKWELQVTTDGAIQTAPTLVDLDGDGNLDFVVATWQFDGQNKICAYRGNDQQLLWSRPISDHVYHGTAVADLDNDGKPELVIGAYNDTLYCLNGEDGSINWTYVGGGGYVGAPATIADLDNDGECEVIFGSWYKIIVLSHDGILKWEYNTPGFEQAFRGVAVSDVDGDSHPDLIFGTDGGKVIALKGSNGSLIWTVDLAAEVGDPNFSIDHAPIVSDFNQDGITDVFIVGGYSTYPDFSQNYGKGFMISTGANGKGPDWLMFQYDPKRQSSLCTFETTSINETPIEQGFSVYPNPFGEDFYISFTQAMKEISIYLFNSEGKVVLKRENQSGQEFKIQTSHLPAGNYFLKIQQSGREIGTQKMVLQR